MTAKTVRRFAPVVSMLFAICAIFSGCSIVQPSRAEMAGANYSLVEEPARYNICIELVRGNTGMVYESTVETKGKEAHWRGEARIYTMGACFSQVCETLCDESASVKQWRGKWCGSQNISPALVVGEWLHQTEQGLGHYSQTTQTPMMATSPLFSAEECYTVKFENQMLNWAGLCDAHIDSLFGGDAFLREFETGNVMLYFAEEELTLEGILIFYVGDDCWMEITIIPHRADAGPEIDLQDLEIGEGILSEEWNMTQTA